MEELNKKLKELFDKRTNLKNQISKIQNEIHDTNDEINDVKTQICNAFFEKYGVHANDKIIVTWKYPNDLERRLECFYSGKTSDTNAYYSSMVQETYPIMLKPKKDGTMSKLQFSIFDVPSLDKITNIEKVEN